MNLDKINFQLEISSNWMGFLRYRVGLLLAMGYHLHFPKHVLDPQLWIRRASKKLFFNGSTLKYKTKQCLPFALTAFYVSAIWYVIFVTHRPLFLFNYFYNFF